MTAVDDLLPDTAPEGWGDIEASDEQRAGYRIRSDREASWAFRKMAAYVAEHERIKYAYDEEIERLTASRDAALRPVQGHVGFFERVLIAYRHELEAGNPDLPLTYKVPYGNLTRRKLPDSIEIVDESALTAWALESGKTDLIRITPAVSELKKLEALHADSAPDGPGVLVTTDAFGGVTNVPGVEHRIGGAKYAAKPA